MNKKDLDLYLGFILIVAVAFFLRFYQLDLRVFHHDEAAVGFFTYKLFNDGVYSYDPSFHGPFMYYVTAEMYRRFGDSVYSSRMLPAIFGASLLFLLIPLRRYIGKSGMVVAAFFLAFSPSFLYYSRFYREDIFISFFTLLALVCAVKYVESLQDRQSAIKALYPLLGALVFLLAIAFKVILPSSMAALRENAPVALVLLLSLLIPLVLILLGIMKYGDRSIGYNFTRVFYLFLGAFSIASMAALKENAYISMALIVFFLFLVFIRERWYKGLIQKLKGSDKKTLTMIAEGLFLITAILVIFSLFYTGTVLDLHGMRIAVEKAIGHWYEMHRIQRIGGPLYFYLPIAGLYELPVLVFGIAGVIYYYIKNNFFMTFVGYWAIANLVVYSYVQEKVPWLILNPLLPLAIIAAAYIGELLSRLKFNSKAGVAILIFLFISLSYFVYSSFLLNYYDYTNPAEPLIQAAQPPQRFSEFLDKVKEISFQYQNQSTEIQVTDTEMETQFLWYMRHYSNVKWRVNISSELNAPLIVVHDGDGDQSDAKIVQSRLRSDYKRLNSSKMSWYFFKLSDITPGYLLHRTMDSPPGEYRFVLFYKPKYLEPQTQQ